MNFITWFVIAIAIIVPVATFIFHNKNNFVTDLKNIQLPIKIF